MNATLRRTISALSHPVTLGAGFLLLLNDHVFRVLWPSWWTGKLGDAAWLFIAPLAFLFLLAACLPGFAKKNRTLLPMLSFGLTGFVYILGNMWPAFLAWLSGLIRQASGMTVLMVSDTGDLLALPVLGLGYLFWKSMPEVNELLPAKRAAGLLAALLAAGLTIANMAAPQYGVNGVELKDGKIIACSAYEAFSSEDGGITWMLSEVEFGGACPETWGEKLSSDWQGQEYQYFYNREDQTIDRSMDGGATWQVDYDLRAVSQAGQALSAKLSPGNVFFTEGPLDAVFDPATGNVVAAMGLEGVLVRTPDGTWHPSAVGEFAVRKVNTLQGFAILLTGEMVLAVFLALLLMATVSLKFFKKWMFVVPWVISWLLWIFAGLIQPALYNNYPFPMQMILAAMALFILPVAVFAIVKLQRQGKRTLLPAVCLALAGMSGYLVPFILWAKDILSNYSNAMILSYGIALIVLIIMLSLIKGSRIQNPPTVEKDYDME